MTSSWMGMLHLDLLLGLPVRSEGRVTVVVALSIPATCTVCCPSAIVAPKDKIMATIMKSFILWDIERLLVVGFVLVCVL